MKITKLLVLGAMLLMGNMVAMAADFTERTAPTVADVKATPVNFEAEHQYLLYNTGAKLFFSQGNAWGTKASGHGEQAQALRMYFTKYVPTDGEWDGKTYIFKIYSSIRNTTYSWHECFFDSQTAMFVDRASQANLYWEVEQVGDKVYRLKAAQANPDFKSDGTQFVGRDETVAQDDANLSDVYDNANAYPLSPMLTEGEGKHIDWVFYDADIFPIYEAAEQLKKEIVSAEEQGIDVAAYVAVYNNANATLAEIEKAIDDVKAAVAANMANGSVEHPTDASSFITNGTFDGNVLTGWSGSGWGSYNPKENAERYNMTYNTYQNLEGLMPGVYAFSANAFYRAGNAGPAYTNFKAKNEASRYAKLYAAVGEDTLFVAIVSPYEGAPTAAQGVGSESNYKDGDVTYYIPNDMIAAEYYMHDLGLYNNKVLVGVGEDGKLTVGSRKDTTTDGDWAIFDDFKLTYYGNAAESYKYWVEQAFATLPDYTATTDAYTKEYMEAYAAVREQVAKDVADAKVSNSAEVLALIADFTEKIAAVEAPLVENIALWKQYAAIVDKATETAANEQLNQEYIIDLELADYSKSFEDEYEDLAMNNEELTELIAEISEKITAAERQPIDGANVSYLLTNPGFDDGDAGWTGRSTITDIAHSCAEAYEKQNFDFYQVVEDAPVGVYEISLQGFVRAGANDQAWPAYRDADGKIEPMAWVYLNKKQTALNNCFDVQAMTLADYDLSPENLYGPEPYALLSAAGDSITNADGASIWVPNGMSTSQDAFTKGYYQKSAFGLVAQDGDAMRIGIKGSLGTSCWAIWDNFQLTYRGYKADVVREVLDEEIENLKAQRDEADVYYGTNVREEIEAVLTEAAAVRESENGRDMFGTLTKIFEVGDTLAASKATFAELEALLGKLTEAYMVSEADLSVQQQAAALVTEVGAAIATYTDENAKAKIVEINALIKSLKIPAGFDNATDDNPKDASWLIENPVYENNDNEGWTTDKNVAISYNICEVYNSDFDYYQDIEGLPEGTYELNIQGFYRFGFAADDYAAYTENPAENNNLKLYVNIDDTEIAVDMPRLAAGAEDYEATAAEDGTFAAAGGMAWVADPTPNEDASAATGKQVSNNMEQAANQFAEGKYQAPTITFKSGADGKARIGLKKEVQQEGNWCIWGNWKLTYYGKNSSKTVTDTDGIAEIGNAPKTAKTEYFNLNGARIDKAQKGVVIVKQTLSDGSVKVKKTVVK